MLLPTLPDPEPGLAEGFADATVANYDQFRTNDQTTQDAVENTFDLFFGRGVIEGTFTHPVVTAGTGLSANVGPLVALIGTVYVPASGTVLLPASTTSTIWLLQVGARLVATNGTDPGTDENWSIVLGTATTDATHVTSRADTFAVVSRPGSSTAGGTVTSVGLSLPGSEFNVSGSPVTVAGTLSGSWKTQAAGKVLASPATGGAAVPTFRPIALSDLPAGVGPTTGIYNVVDFGADPTGTADTSPIVETLKAAIGTNGGGVIYYPPGTYWHSTGHVFTDRNLVVRGAGIDESVLEGSDDLGPGAVPAPLFWWSCAMASSISLGADCNPGDRQITLVVGGVLASGLAVGDWIVLSDTLSNSTTNPNGFFHTRIQAIAGDVLTLERRCPYLFQISQVAIARYGPSNADCPRRMLVGAGISDCTVKVGPSSNGSGGRGTEHTPDINRCVLVQFDYCDAPTAERVRAIGGAYAAPVIPSSFVALTCNAPAFRDCDARDSGEGGCGYWFQYSTAARCVDCSTHQVAFGASAQRAAYCLIQGLHYHGRQAQLAGRGAKLEYGCTLGEISGCDMTDAPFFGAYVFESWDCSIDGNVVAYNGGSEISSPTLRHGIQSGGDHALRNRIVNNTIKGASGYAVSINPATAGASTHCLVAGNFTDGTTNGVYLGGSDNDCKSNRCGNYGSGGVGVVGGASSTRNRIQNNTFLNGGSGRSIQTDVSAGGNFIGGNTDDNLLFSPHATDLLIDRGPAGDTLVVTASDSRDVNRADKGFHCDGTADDVEIQAAVNALSAKGGTVRLMEGTYSFNAPVNLLSSNVSVIGNGPGAICKRNFAASGTGLFNVGNGVLALSGNTLRDFSIDGQKATFTGTANYGINFTTATLDSEVHNVVARNCGGASFAVGAATRIQFDGCRSFGSGDIGFWFNASVEGSCRGCASVGDAKGIYCLASTVGMRLVGNDVISSSQIGIFVSGGTRPTIMGNTVSGSGQQGAYLDGVTLYALTGNEFYQNGNHAMRVRSTDGTITGNVCGNNTGSGIAFLTATRATVQGNVFFTNSAWGIDIPADTTGIVLGPNRFQANTSGTVNDLSPVTAAGATRHVAQGGAVRALTAAYTLVAEESLVTCDATTAAFNVTLPAAATALRNWRFTVKKTDSSANAVTVVGTVDGVANPTLTAQNQTMQLVCDGAAYRRTDMPAGAGAIPIGGIILWSGSVASVPANWHLCDGTTGTPDLRDKFVVGAGSSYAVAASGGSSGHSHPLSGAAVVGAGSAHSHNLDGTGSTGGTTPASGPQIGSVNLASGGDKYVIAALASADLPHSHFTTGHTASESAHTHNLSGATDSTSSLPPYFALCYLMRTA